MTAPLTPHDKPMPEDEPTPGPQPSGSTAYPVPERRDEGEHGPVSMAEIIEAVLVALAVGVLGVGLGLLWVWLAPRVPLISNGQAIYLENSEAEDAIAADGLFVLLGLGMGLLTAVAVFLFRKRGGIPLVLGLAVGGILGSLLAWRLGVSLGPDTDIRAHAREVGPGVTFDKPLELNAKGALLAWPVAAMAVHLALTGLFGPRDPQPQTHWAAPAPGPGPESAPDTPRSG